MTLGQSFHRQKDVRSSARHNPFHQSVNHRFPQAATVTTNSSLHTAVEQRPLPWADLGSRYNHALLHNSKFKSSSSLLACSIVKS